MAVYSGCMSLLLHDINVKESCRMESKKRNEDI